MNYGDTIKLAYGIGCIATLHQAGVDPAVFYKRASISGDEDLLKMADAVAFAHNCEAAQPQYVEKVATVVFDKQAGKLQDVVDTFRRATRANINPGQGVLDNTAAWARSPWEGRAHAAGMQIAPLRGEIDILKDGLRTGPMPGAELEGLGDYAMSQYAQRAERNAFLAGRYGPAALATGGAAYMGGRALSGSPDDDLTDKTSGFDKQAGKLQDIADTFRRATRADINPGQNMLDGGYAWARSPWQGRAHAAGTQLAPLRGDFDILKDGLRTGPMPGAELEGLGDHAMSQYAQRAERNAFLAGRYGPAALAAGGAAYMGEELTDKISGVVRRGLEAGSQYGKGLLQGATALSDDAARAVKTLPMHERAGYMAGRATPMAMSAAGLGTAGAYAKHRYDEANEVPWYQDLSGTLSRAMGQEKKPWYQDIGGSLNDLLRHDPS